MLPIRPGRPGRPGDPPQPPIKPITVTVPTARQITGLSNTTVYQLIKQKKLEVRKIGTRTLITYASIEALLQSDTTAPAA
jgi:excisionase family DNA binding protein